VLATAGFKPVGIPMGQLESLSVGLDELEAIRLADVEGLYQEEAARRMGVSRPTYARILNSARAKVGRALLEGKALIFSEAPVAWVERTQEACPIHEGQKRRGRACRCTRPPGAGTKASD
jgi:predicted DNA-binding protein (UPF0251 family)